MKICIDAGHNHSGFDTGAVGNGLKEQDVTFLIAYRLKTLLENNGFTIIMTREKNTDNIGKNAKDAINERARIANKSKCDYYISIHCNAGGGTGTETLIYGRGGKAEPLAKCVNSKIVKHFGLKDRGIKERPGLGVLRLTDMPAILVETAFIDHKNDSLLLRNRTSEFADMIFEGVCEFLGVSPVSELESEKNELTTVNDIVWELENRGIITDKELWINKLDEDSNSYWLARKCVNYIRGL